MFLLVLPFLVLVPVLDHPCAVDVCQAKTAEELPELGSSEGAPRWLEGSSHRGSQEQPRWQLPTGLEGI